MTKATKELVEAEVIETPKPIDKFIPDLSRAVNLEEIVKAVFSKALPSFVGVYVPLDEKFKKGIEGEEADTWANANPFNINWEKLTDEAKEILTNAVLVELKKITKG
jgi:hypothetical protein